MSLHTLFDKHLDHMLVKLKKQNKTKQNKTKKKQQQQQQQNRTVRTIQNFVLFDQKWLTIFDKVLTPFWKTFLWLKQLFDAKILI